MTDFFDSSDDDFIDIDVVTGRNSSRDEVEKRFLPWHKPRKQFVRAEQWWKLLFDTFDSKFSEMEEIRYFGLPGVDLLDLEYFSERLSECGNAEDTKIRAYGLIDNQADKSKIDSRLSVLLDKSNVDESSKVDELNFGSLSDERSLAWTKMNRFGLYHFINLDFCNCIFSNENILLSIFKLISYQLKRQVDDDWLLCISTRFDKDGVNRNIFSKLENVLSSLKDDCGVQAAIESCFGALDIQTGMSNEIEEYSEHQVYELVQVCFILWIINSTITQQGVVELSSSLKYKVDPSKEYADLFSLVFKFNAVKYLKEDEMGLVKVKQSKVPPTESALLQKNIARKIKALTRISKSADVDSILNSNFEVYEKYSDQKIELLRQCGFDTNGYKEAFPFPLNTRSSS